MGEEEEERKFKQQSTAQTTSGSSNNEQQGAKACVQQGYGSGIRTWARAAASFTISCVRVRASHFAEIDDSRSCVLVEVQASMIGSLP